MAIARNVGILTGEEGELSMTPEELAPVSDEDCRTPPKSARVVARSTPSDKLRLVQACTAKAKSSR